MSTVINTAEIPVSTVQSATAASYTIPADRYAIVRAQVKNGGSLNIGGITVLASSTWSGIASNASPKTVTTTGGVAAMSVPLVSSAPSGSQVGTPNSTQNVAWTNSTSGSTSNNGDTFTNATAMTSNSETYKVPAGTVIVGSGDARYHIELYRIPGSAT